MGLIARAIEASGIPTLCLSSALSITQSVQPPRSVFVDFPLGHTSGKPFEPAQQDDLLTRTLAAFTDMQTAGDIRQFSDCWAADDSWKHAVLNPAGDDRSERADGPQYQLDSDRLAAEAALARDGCPTCIWVGETTNERSA